MKKTILLATLMLLSVWMNAFAADYYVATNGNDSNSGSISAPFLTLGQAVSMVTPGDNIYLRGGTYSMGTSFVIDRSKSGTSGAMISVLAYGSEVPVLQFDDVELSSSRGIVQDAHYWHWKGIIIEKAGDNGMLLSANYCIIEECVFRYNHDSGLQLSRYSTSADTKSEWPAYNLILNCESHDNADSDAEDADGFAPKLTVGDGNVFRGCVSHHNIDDGWDMYTKSETGPIGEILLEDCIAHNNGTLSDGSTSGGGDKNGFKLGSSSNTVNHTVLRCIAFNNGKHGFTDNGNIGSIKFYNNTSYNNGDYNYHTRDNATHIFRNNITLSGNHTDRIVGDAPTGCNAFDDTDTQWTLVTTTSDFQTMTPGPDSDPTSNGFLNLASSSGFIDAGCTVSGVAYNGSALDIGAIEYGGTVTPPTTYTLSSSVNGSGSVTPSSGTFNANETVSVTATAASGWEFTGWSGDASGSSNPLSLTMDGNKSIVANFTEVSGQSYTLTVASSGQGSVSPSGGSFADGASVSLTATPVSGWLFSGWSGDASGSSNPLTITMDGNKSITAVFTEDTQSGGGDLGDNLAITGPGVGSDGTSKGGGTSYGNVRDGDTSTYWQPSGTSNERISVKWSSDVTCNTIVIKEIGDVVSSWEVVNHDNGDVLATGSGLGTSKTITFDDVTLGKIDLIIVSASSAPQITEFEVYNATGTPTITTYTLTANYTGQGSVSPTSGTYNDGDQATVTATPASGYEFTGWSGDASGTTNPLTLTMDNHKSMTANFTEIQIPQYTLSVTSSGQGSVSPSSGTFDDGTGVTLTATAASGWSFSSWSGDASGASNPLTITMSSNKSITATFIEDTQSGGGDLGDNLAITGPGVGSDGTSKGGGTSYGNVRDGDTSTYWEPSSTSNERISIKWSSSVTCNTIVIKEIGDVVGSWEVVNHDTGDVLATGSGLGSEKTITFSDVTLDKINLVILSASSAPQIAEFEVYNASGSTGGGDNGGGGTTTYTLSASVTGQGSVTPSSGTYDNGTQVTVTATAASGYEFSGWGGDASGSTNPLTLTLDANKSIVANFISTSTPPPSTGGPIGYASLAGGTTGGQGGVSYTCSTGDCIMDLIDQKKDDIISQPLTIYVNGTVTPSNTSFTKIDIKDVRDVSIIGVGTSGVFDGIGIKVYRAGNVIIQNVTVHHVNIGDKDAVSIEGPADHVWVDHCELYAEYDGVDKDYYDGLLDAKKDAEYITYSYNYMHDSWKMMLVGSSDSDNYDRKITIHHNYFDNVNSRMPLFRFGSGHIFNNYYSGIASTGVNSRMGACLKVENNYFKDSQNPIVSAYSSTLGATDESGNTFDNVTWNLSQSDVNDPLDCTASIPYSYTSILTTSANVPSVIVANAGVGKISSGARLGKRMEVMDKLADVNLFPNPATNFFTLEVPDFTGAEEVRIVSLQGKEMLKIKLEDQQTGVDISMLPKGIYIIQLKSHGPTRLKMFIKE
ncbi:T9SS type A sorting domain-containing protein [Limibacter armeniacum]|uniref:InlB B-repeat-containing protein n=1 Tax=Limibacter armeniacum TaxID=466084 RepID=UPI002FE63807